MIYGSNELKPIPMSQKECAEKYINLWNQLEKLYMDFSNITGSYFLLSIPFLVCILVLRLGHGLFLDDGNQASISRYIAAGCVAGWLFIFIEIGHHFQDRVECNRSRLRRWIYLQNDSFGQVNRYVIQYHYLI